MSDYEGEPMITESQIAAMGADPANADLPFAAPEKPWKPWHSPVMVLAGTDGEGRPWLYLAARCGWTLGYDSQHSPGVLARYAVMHIEGCDICKKDARPAIPENETARCFLLDRDATYEVTCPDCGGLVSIDLGAVYQGSEGTDLRLARPVRLRLVRGQPVVCPGASGE